MSSDTENQKDNEDMVKRKYKLDEKRYEQNGKEINTADLIPASFLSRGAAFFIDTAILTGPYLLLNLFLFTVFGVTTHSLLAKIVEIVFTKFDLIEPKTAVALTIFASVITWFLITLIFGILYHSVLEIYQGASYGKKILGIKIVDAEGYEVLPIQFVERNIAKLLSLALFGSGFLLPIVSLRKEALHDMLSKTRVVRDELAKKEQLIAGQCFGLAMAIGLYLLLMNEQTTLEQLKPLLPSLELSDKLKIELDFESHEVEIADQKSQKNLNKEIIAYNQRIFKGSDKPLIKSALDRVVLKKEKNTNISNKETQNETSEPSKLGEKDLKKKDDKNKELNLVSALENIKKLKTVAKSEIGYIQILDQRFYINGVYARVDNLDSSSKKWSINLYFFENKLKVIDYEVLNKTLDPLATSPIKNNKALLSMTISYRNKSIVCQRSDYTHGMLHLSDALRKSIFKTTGVYPDLTLAIDDDTLQKQNMFKAPCVATFMQSEVAADLNGRSRISNNVYTELQWKFRFIALLFEFLINDAKIYKGTKNSFAVWNPRLNLLTIANLNKELTKEDIKEIYKKQNFDSVQNKLNVLIHAKIDQITTRLNTNSIKDGYKLIFYKNNENGFDKEFIVKKEKYNLPKVLSGVLSQGSKIIGRFKGQENFKDEDGKVTKLKWTIPIDSRVLVIK